MIENSDRGITLNKSLAWTMLVAFATFVWWGGATITSLQAQQSQLSISLTQVQAQQARDLDAIARQVTADDGRIRVIEQSQSRTIAQLEALADGLGDVKDEQKQTNELLRQMVQGRAK